MSDSPQPYFPGQFTQPDGRPHGAPGPYPTGPYPTGPYAPSPYPNYAPRPVYAPLDRKHKRASFWAGFIGLNLLNLGSGLVLVALLVGLFVTLFAGISASAEPSSGLQGFDDFVSEYNLALWLIGAGVLGLIIFAAGLLVSVGILRGARVRRPWAVTWAAFGISVPVLFIVNTIASTIGQFVGYFATFSTFFAAAQGGSAPDQASVATGVVVALVFVVLSIGLVGVVGWLAWWWMAHVFRERVPVSVK